LNSLLEIAISYYKSVSAFSRKEFDTRRSDKSKPICGIEKAGLLARHFQLIL